MWEEGELTNMKRTIRISVIAFVAALALCENYMAQSQRIARSGVYNRIVAIKGHVEVIAPESSRPMLGSGTYLVFQRDGCADCLIGTHADANGDYKILVGRGRYKLIVYNPSTPTYDLIAPEQPRYIDAVPRLQDTQFDIKLIVPSER